MTNYIDTAGLRVARVLDDLVRDSIAPGTGIAAEAVWKTLADVVTEIGPRHQALLDQRDQLQARIDEWLHARRGRPLPGDDYLTFHADIG
jgi:malate synthase